LLGVGIEVRYVPKADILTRKRASGIIAVIGMFLPPFGEIVVMS